MKNKINIAEILKDCPKGTKLYSPLYGECKLERIHNELKKIIVSTSDGMVISFYSDGKYFQIDNSECMLFPSKENTTWEGFQRPFMDGDILISRLEGCEGNPFIFKQINGFGNAECYCAINCYGELIFNSDNWTSIKGCRLATTKEKEKLFDAIKSHGYKWHEETKTLKKLPETKFKVGDRIKNKNVNLYHTVNSILGGSYIVDDNLVLDMKMEHLYELAPNIKPKFKIGDRVKKNKDYISGIVVDIFDDSFKVTYDGGGCSYVQFHCQYDWELVPDKFDITTLKPFDKVLVRGGVGQKWAHDFFGFMDKGFPFVCVGYYVSQCIPFEGNEHLLGTTDDCDEYYKTWEK